jgi:alpha-galactosidase
LCLKFALRSALVRSAMHRRLWINDPDCLMLRETRTQLTADERHCLANAIVITGGMHLISDRLAELPLAAWARMREISRLAARCDRGRAWALDLMEREFPEVVYNTIGYLAVFNFEDRPVERVVDLGWWLEERYWQGVAWCDIWDGMVVRGQGRRLELGRMPPHSSMLFEAVTNEGTGGGPSSGDSGL